VIDPSHFFTAKWNIQKHYYRYRQGKKVVWYD